MCNVIIQAHKRSDSERRQVSVLNLVIFAAVISYYVQTEVSGIIMPRPVGGGAFPNSVIRPFVCPMAQLPRLQARWLPAA